MLNGTVEKNSTGYYHFLFTELGDPRTSNWFLVRHPVIFPIVFFWLYCVTKVGPRLMKNKPAFELKNVLIIYNALQVCISIWIVWEAADVIFRDNFSLRCEPVDPSWSPRNMRIARGAYVYYLAKISELLDTIFFVLRKKFNQLTFLHLYHHCVMPMISWGVVKYYPGGHAVFPGFINSFVHIIMYTYYMLAACGPQLQKYLWWKKYITNLQMVQFCIGFLHSSQLLFYDCGFPKWSMFFTLPNAIFFYYLFNDFYNQAYKQDRKKIVNGGLQNEKVKNGHLNGEKINGLHNGNRKKSL